MISNQDVDEEIQLLRREALIDLIEEALLYDHERQRGELAAACAGLHRQRGDRVKRMALEFHERIANLACNAASTM